MGTENLNQLDLISAVFSLIVVIIYIIIGISIIFKKKQQQQKKVYVFVGTALVFLSSAWWGIVVSLICFVIFNYELNSFFYILLGCAFIPVALVCWMYSFSVLVYPYFKKQIVLIFLIISITYEIFLFIFLLTDPTVVATIEGRFNMQSNFFSLSFRIFAIGVVIITGILFTTKTMKLDNPEVQWRGRFLLIAFLSFASGALIDSLPLNPITLVLARLLLISSAFEYYLAFFLPGRMANWLTRKEKK